MSPEENDLMLSAFKIITECQDNIDFRLDCNKTDLKIIAILVDKEYEDYLIETGANLLSNYKLQENK